MQPKGRRVEQAVEETDAAVLIVYPTTAPQAAPTASLVNRLRTAVVPQATAGSDVRQFIYTADDERIATRNEMHLIRHRDPSD